MMLQLLVGMLLGAMVSTETGRSIGNQEESVWKEDAHEADPEAV